MSATIVVPVSVKLYQTTSNRLLLRISSNLVIMQQAWPIAQFWPDERNIPTDFGNPFQIVSTLLMHNSPAKWATENYEEIAYLNPL